MYKWAVVLVWLCFASVVCGAVAACPTSSPGNTFGSFGASSLTNGCSQVDKTFSLFAITGESCPPGAGCTTSDTTNTYIYGAGSLTGGASPGFAGTITAILNGGSPTVMVLNVTGTTVVDTANLTYAVQANVGAPTNPSLRWFIGGNIGLVPAGSIVTGAAGGVTEFIQVVETFCINSTTVTGCSAANSGSLTGTLTVNGSTIGTSTTFVFSSCSAGASVGTCSGGATGSSIALSGFTSSIGVSDTFTLSRVSGNLSTLTLNNIGNTFGEFAVSTVPEPSTFLLSGCFLAGIVCLRRRQIWIRDYCKPRSAPSAPAVAELEQPGEIV